ncbi:MAG: hypothetical protein ABFD07_10130 [Methanobacterium sp.]
MIKKAIALVFCLLLLCSCVAAAATYNNSTDAKHTNNDSNTKQETSQGKVISLSNPTESSKNNSSNSDSNIKSEEVDNGNFLTNAVSSGISLFIKGLCDGIYADVYADGHGPGNNNTESVNGTEYTNYTDSLYDALTSVPHPYENQTIVKMYGGYLNITLYCIAIFVLGALIGRSIARMRLDKNIDARQAAFIGGIAICGLALISNIIYMYTLDVVEALNHYIVLPAMPALTPDPTDDLLISIIQSFCDFLLLIFFNIRYYMLNVVAVGCSIVAVLLVPEFSRDFAEDCIEKIIRILFLQPAALFVYVVCILSAPSFPDGFKAVSHISTTVLVFATCWYFMFGSFTLLKKGVSFVIRKGVKKA